MRRLREHSWIFIVALMLIGTSCSVSKKSTKNLDQTSKELGGAEKMAFDETFFNGLSAKYAGNHKGAIANFQQCLTLDPDNAAVKYELSDLYIQMGYNEMAVQMAQDVVTTDPGNR